jgi:NAD(P)-dependent dehydrogenase (short-subunit alcohol dehydrogenase family)
MSLKGKVAIVTGGNSGIARVIVLELARLHANIVIDYVCHPEATEALEQQVGKLGDQSIGVKADVSRLADLRMDHWAAGLSNGYTTFFLSPEHGEGFYWGVGPVLYYPSATNSTVGVNKWGSGPSAAFIKKDESPWVFGAVANNIWSVGGPPGSSDRTN